MDRLADYDFALPDELIAQRPASRRTESRLLVIDEQEFKHRQFSEIVDFLHPADTLVVNDTLVVKARFKAKKDSSGSAEVLVERIVDERDALCQVRVSKPLHRGRKLFASEHVIEILGREGEFYRLRFPCPVNEFLNAFGTVPLPPYILRSADSDDEKRYQTVYGSSPGAVAAPTAGLHFDSSLLSQIERMGTTIVPVTLHVGAGTFQPVRGDDISQHRMHGEIYSIPDASYQAIDNPPGRVVAVGTTVVRALESMAQTGLRSGETTLFIRPGYRFQIVDALITNFHLPQSTLLMLVSAFAGIERIRAAYREAVDRRYRFFSYGDCMMCERFDV